MWFSKMVLRRFLSVVTSSDTNKHRSLESRVRFKKNVVEHYLKQTAGVDIFYNSEDKI